MHDEKRVNLEFPRPIETIEPLRLVSPLVFSSPHSGSIYPKRFLAELRLDPLTLRRSEDAFVDELFLPCVGLGAPLLRALFPRAYLDVNREPFELDPQIFEGPMPDFANTRSLRVAVGLGTIPRVVGDAQPIYRKTLPLADGLRRIEGLYRPYHESLRSLIARAQARFGVAILVDCHSMPSNAADVGGLDIVLGDRYGASASPRILEALELSSPLSRLSGTPQQALRRRLHNRTLRGACRRRARRADRDCPLAIPRRALHRSNRELDQTSRRSVQGGSNFGAGIWRRPQPSENGGGVASPRVRISFGASAQKRRPPCRHGGL